jgi:hypothetical protein
MPPVDDPLQILSTATHRNGSGIGEGFGLVKFGLPRMDGNRPEVMLAIVFPVEGCGQCERCEYFGTHTLDGQCNAVSPFARNGRVAVLSLHRMADDNSLDIRFGHNSFDGGYFEGELRSAFKDPASEARFLEYIADGDQPSEED